MVWQKMTMVMKSAAMLFQLFLLRGDAAPLVLRGNAVPVVLFQRNLDAILDMQNLDIDAENAVVDEGVFHDELRYQAVVALKSNGAMGKFIRSVVQSYKGRVNDEAELPKLAAEFSGRKSIKSYASLLDELKRLNWIASDELESEGFMNTVSFDETGYQAVASLRSNGEMGKFIRKVVHHLGGSIKDDAELSKMAIKFSGRQSTKSYAFLLEDLSRLNWVDTDRAAEGAASCIDLQVTGYDLNGGPASCGQLQPFCGHAAQGAGIRRACCETCSKPAHPLPRQLQQQLQPRALRGCIDVESTGFDFYGIPATCANLHASCDHATHGSAIRTLCCQTCSQQNKPTVCSDLEVTGLDLHGAPAACSQLQPHCNHPKTGAAIRFACCKTCTAADEDHKIALLEQLESTESADSDASDVM